ncbi:uncharacterized protein LOC105205980 [Solenopsis invicta]|uniref:uncharacterized protein LOC105205980 n=1 Tax=Solenopsis invicta TaxID=13686 RepID=UPI0005960E2E|nr:uncharacterized protein LOC105205980 [Solenopsis invicta]
MQTPLLDIAIRYAYRYSSRICILYHVRVFCTSREFSLKQINTPSTSKDKDSSTMTPMRRVNNCVAFMFDEIRYELDGVEIDRNRNVGITSTMKNYVSLTDERSRILKNAGWDIVMQRTAGEFSYCVPLNVLLGFCEDYKRLIIINARHELILIRARNDANCIIANISTDERVLTLLRVQWKMPHVMLNDVNKLALLRTLESGQYLSMGFRSWDLYEFPLLQSTTKHLWAVKTATQLKKPRYIIFTLQTGRQNIFAEDASKFDHCKLTNVKLYLNSEFYPYNDMNLDYDNHKYAILYDMYTKFRKVYYGCNREPLLSFVEFLHNGPLVVIDCSRQNESVKSATVDVRIEFEYKENIPENITAYCLIIHDRVVQYNPLTNVVRKIV